MSKNTQNIRCGNCLNASILTTYPDESPKRYKCPVYDLVVREIDGKYCPRWVERKKEPNNENV
jgi:hypothetical protein